MKHVKKTVCSALAVVGIIFTQSLEDGLQPIEGGMQISRQGLEHIAKWEGCRLEAYQCSADVWSIFLGHTKGVKPGDTGTEYEAAVAFVKDVKEHQKVVNQNLKSKVTQSQFDMMVSFTYNFGGRKFRSSTLLKLFNQNVVSAESCKQFLRWVFVNGKDCRIKENDCAGIPERRLEEYLICLNGYT